MSIDIRPVDLTVITALRDAYRDEMACQIVHDSIHARQGLTREYAIDLDGTLVGYGSVAVGGPWQDLPTLYEYYVVREYRTRLFDLFASLLSACGTARVMTQSNNRLLTVMLQTFAHDLRAEAILFEDAVTTTYAPDGAYVRAATPDDAEPLARRDLDRDAAWLLEVDGEIAGAGGVLYHYNRPYGDVYMAIAEVFRRRGLGAYLVQELKRICYASGSVPAARTNVSNVASRETLQKAGFVPCGHLLVGMVDPT